MKLRKTEERDSTDIARHEELIAAEQKRHMEALYALAAEIARQARLREDVSRAEEDLATLRMQLQNKLEVPRGCSKKPAQPSVKQTFRGFLSVVSRRRYVLQ